MNQIFKFSTTIILLFFIGKIACAQPLDKYHHNTFWGRVVLSDKITGKLKWELFLQDRTQNDPESKLNIFKHHQLTSYWLWLHYQVNKDLRVSVSPFCYFNTISLYPQPPAMGDRGVRELRWAAQVEHTQRLARFQFANRYSLEYRYRDLEIEDVFVTNFRARYRARFEFPIKKFKHATSLIFYDEIFLEFGKALKSSPAVFNQNRLYAGFSTEVVKNVKFNLGYMYLIMERPTGRAIDISNTIWAIVTFDNLFSQFYKSKEEPSPKK
jgi:hypothetical protein